MSTDSTQQLVAALSATARQQDFSGVIVLQHNGQTLIEFSSGLADRAGRRPMTLATRLATASATKGFTALTIVSMIEEGLLGFHTRLRDLVGDDLPHVDPTVTIEQLLGHTSGVGDYIDEDAIESNDDHVLDVPVHVLEGPADYVPLLNRYEQVSPPGERFVYNNAGYIMLALAIEGVSGGSYHDEVRRRVFGPAGMIDTDFLRSDDLPAGTALGYLDNGRTNVFHLPVIGTGDGGAYTTADMLRFWDALLAGRIVARPLVERMIVPNGSFPEPTPGEESYGLGFWVATDTTTVQLEGLDAGVSFRSGAHPRSGLRYCIIANDADGAWPLAVLVDNHLEMAAGKG